MSNNLPVVAAIPNFNMASLLPKTLQPLLEQGYDGVVVLDDASNDESREIIRDYGREVEFVAGEVNVGAGANRNRILHSRTLEKFGAAVIHFVDADTIITSERTPEQIREMLTQTQVGVFGGLVRNEDGTQHNLNFGPNICGLAKLIKACVSGRTHTSLDAYGHHHNLLRAKTLRSKLNFLLGEWPNTFEKPQPRNVGWVIEANMVTSSEVLAAIQFDPVLRFHEIQDFTRKLSLRGLACRFEPSIAATRTDQLNVRGNSRRMEGIKAELRLAARYSRPSNRKPVTIG